MLASPRAASRWDGTQDDPCWVLPNEGEHRESADRIGGFREREKQCKQQLLATPWDSYVKGDLSIVSTSNLPAEAQIDVANFSVALFASQITRLSYAKSSVSRSPSLSPARAMLIVSDHEEYP